jgi:hypothetical protein
MERKATGEKGTRILRPSGSCKAQSATSGRSSVEDPAAEEETMAKLRPLVAIRRVAGVCPRDGATGLVIGDFSKD